MIGVCVCVCANQKIFLSKDEMAAKFCTQNRSLCVCKCVCVCMQAQLRRASVPDSTYQMWESSGMGSLDLVKKFFAMDPGKQASALENVAPAGADWISRGRPLPRMRAPRSGCRLLNWFV